MGNRILIVDDEQGVRDFLCRSLTQVGAFSVEHTGSAEEALCRIEKEPFSLVLTDLKLPNMDGLQLITEILNRKPDILTIVMTGFASIDSALEAMKRGASDYFRKPVDIEEMTIRIRRVLDERSRFVKLKEVAESLEKTNQELKRLDAVKSEFVSLTSHELRTPLTVIKSQIQMILEGKIGKVNKKQTKFLWMVEENVNRLIKIVKDLLDLSKIQCGSIEMRYEELDLFDLVEFMVALFSAEADVKSIHLKNNVPKEASSILADREKIERILFNLIGNGIKFTGDGGEIAISSTFLRDKRDMVISVSDSGIGIPEDQLEKVFEKFHRVDGELVGSSDGTGLGLAITKGLVEAHRGNIWVESEMGIGSTFRFTIPQSENNLTR